MGDEKGKPFTGKISGLIFDHFGDFEGFMLETRMANGSFSAAKGIWRAAERVWRDRLRITVHAEEKDPHRPLSVVVHEPPAAFES